MFNRSETYLCGGKPSKDTLQDLSETFDVGRREHDIVENRRNLHRQVRYPVFPTVGITGARFEVAGATTSAPHPDLANDEGSRSIVVRWIQLHQQLGLPPISDLREVP